MAESEDNYSKENVVITVRKIMRVMVMITSMMTMMMTINDDLMMMTP